MLNSYSTADKVLLAVDCIIFGFDNEGLKILLIKRDFEPEKGKWSLMGGFLEEEEDLEVAANRILYDLTGLKDIYFEETYNVHYFDFGCVGPEIDFVIEYNKIIFEYFLFVYRNFHHLIFKVN